MKIILTKKFIKKIKKLSLKYQKRVEERLDIFEENPKDRILNNHKLKGKLKGKRSINITGDIRAVFTQNEDEMVFVFLNIGTHPELYN